MYPPIIALDVPDQTALWALLDQFDPQEKLFVKVGMELFYSEGPLIIRALKGKGHRIFLDLKLHDIPMTVKRAMTVLAALGVDIVNVHAAGGREMMRAAKAGLIAGTPAGEKVPQLFAVTQLTSTSTAQMNEEQGIPGTVTESVLRYAKSAEMSGLDGVVCSALEAQSIHQTTSAKFLTLTPGIRPAGTAVNDQKRVVTPARAVELTSDMIVVGRPITQARDPYQAYLNIKNEWSRLHE